MAETNLKYLINDGILNIFSWKSHFV